MARSTKIAIFAEILLINNERYKRPYISIH